MSGEVGSGETQVCCHQPRGHLPHVRAIVALSYNVVMLVKYSFRIDSSLVDVRGQVRALVDKSKFKEPGAPRHGSDGHPEGCEDCLHSSRPPGALLSRPFPRPRPQGWPQGAS